MHEDGDNTTFTPAHGNQEASCPIPGMQSLRAASACGFFYCEANTCCRAVSAIQQLQQV